MVRETDHPPGEDELVTEVEDNSSSEESYCTWKKFKDQVEAAGVTDDMEAAYIDWDDGHDVQVRICEDKKSFNVT